MSRSCREMPNPNDAAIGLRTCTDDQHSHVRSEEDQGGTTRRTQEGYMQATLHAVEQIHPVHAASVLKRARRLTSYRNSTGFDCWCAVDHACYEKLSLLTVAPSCLGSPAGTVAVCGERLVREVSAAPLLMPDSTTTTRHRQSMGTHELRWVHACENHVCLQSHSLM